MPESFYPLDPAILASAVFRKSTRSDNSGSCVEVADLVSEHGIVLVRDTKNRGGAVLAFRPDEWRAFVGGVKDREFDL